MGQATGATTMDDPRPSLSPPGIEMIRALEQLKGSVLDWDEDKAVDSGIRGILSGIGDPYASLLTKSASSVGMPVAEMMSKTSR